MSPRRNRPARSGPVGRGAAQPAELDLERVRRGVESVQTWGGEQWRVRHIPASAAVKTYRCPGCDHEVIPGVAHVVVWPVAWYGGEADRRHWHTACWQARHTRSPRPR